MKVLHIAEPFATGVLSFLMDITKRQADDHEVYIAYGIRPLTPSNVETLFDKRIHLIKVDSFKGALGTVVNPKAYLDVYRLYNQIKPDIVHLHSSASGFVGRWAIPCNKTRVFYTPHGFSFLMQDGSALKRKIFWSLEYLSAKRRSRIIACSEGECKEALKLSKNSTYVNNGINLEELKPLLAETTATFHKPIIVCTSGRILYQKNPTLFNHIAQLLPDIRFVWIGEGELKSELTAPNIEITGWITREKALEAVCSADFFILPSLWEGLPISLLEAMFLKRICLVSDVIGNRDVIRTGKNGFICNKAEDYASVITHIIKGEIDGISIAGQASKDVETNYNAATMADKYEEIYCQSIK